MIGHPFVEMIIVFIHLRNSTIYKSSTKQNSNAADHVRNCTWLGTKAYICIIKSEGVAI